MAAGPPAARAVAVDGRTPSGSGHHQTAPVCLPAPMDHVTGAVLAQTEVDGKIDEISRSRPLLEHLDLAGHVVTADALHTQRGQAEWLVTVMHAAYLPVVEANQSTPPASPTGSPAGDRYRPASSTEPRHLPPRGRAGVRAPR